MCIRDRDTAFDVSPALLGTKIHDVTIRPMGEREHYVEEYHPNVAVLTVPQSVADVYKRQHPAWPPSDPRRRPYPPEWHGRRRS